MTRAAAILVMGVGLRVIWAAWCFMDRGESLVSGCFVLCDAPPHLGLGCGGPGTSGVVCDCVLT